MLTHTYFATIYSESESKVQKAKPRMPIQSPTCSADWFKLEGHFQKFCPKADGLKTHFLSPLSFRVFYPVKIPS